MDKRRISILTAELLVFPGFWSLMFAFICYAEVSWSQLNGRRVLSRRWAIISIRGWTTVSRTFRKQRTSGLSVETDSWKTERSATVVWSRSIQPQILVQSMHSIPVAFVSLLALVFIYFDSSSQLLMVSVLSNDLIIWTFL